MATDAALQDLHAYAQSNERVCPMPRRWYELYNIISPPVLERGSSGARLNWIPTGPMILGGWYRTSVHAKRLRMTEREETREALLQYCAVDTLGVVRLLEELRAMDCSNRQE